MSKFFTLRGIAVCVLSIFFSFSGLYAAEEVSYTEVDHIMKLSRQNGIAYRALFLNGSWMTASYVAPRNEYACILKVPKENGQIDQIRIRRPKTQFHMMGLFYENNRDKRRYE